MGGGSLGAFVGLVLGFGGGVWLVLRREARWAGQAVAWLWVAAVVAVIGFCLIAFSD